MSLLKSIVVFRISPEWTAPALAKLEAQLQRNTFVSCGPTQELSVGWVPPRDVDFAALAESIGGHVILKLSVEKKVVPAGALKHAVDERCKELADARGKKVGGKEKKEIKAEMKLTMLPRAFSKMSSNTVWIDAHNRFLVVGAASHKGAELVVKAIVELMFDLGNTMLATPLSTAILPGTAMSNWLLAKDAPAGFNLDRDVELKQPADKSAVKYAKHNLELDEIVNHIKAGKVPTKLALIWEGRVGFVLNEAYGLSKITTLEVDADSGNEEGFDADVAITTAELSQLLPDLLLALGGETVAAE